MSKVKIQGNASGTGVLTITAPNTSTDRTITLPDTTGTLLDENSSVPAANLTGTIADARFPATLPAASAANLTAIPAANVTGTLPAISGANLTNIPSNFTLLSTTTCSNTNDIDITLNTSYTENILRFSGIVMQNNNDTLRMSMSDDNGASYDVRGYCQLNRFTYDSGSWTEFSYTAPGAVTFATDLASASHQSYEAEMTFGQSIANNAQRNFCRLIGHQHGNNLAFNLATLMWNEANPAAIIKLRINGNAGGIASGTIKHYGVG